MKQRSVIFILWLLPFIAMAAPVKLMQIRLEPSIETTRLSFALSDKTKGRVKSLANPHRVLVEFTNTIKRFDPHSLKFPQSPILSVKSENLSGDILRLTFLLKEKVKWKMRFSTNEQGALLELDLISLAPQKKPLTIFSHSDLLNTFSLPEKKPIPSLSAKPENQPVFTVVIDAGHGGKDPGAIGRHGKQEKNIVLAISKRLANELKQQNNIRVLLTRDGDYFVPLRDRLKLARKSAADLFIAIHADAYFEKHAKGASVYALSHRGATSEAAKWLARQENYSELGDVELNALQDRSLMLRKVLIDLAQTTTIQDSLRLGNKMLDVLDKISTLHRKHVEQAPFVVLKSPATPSVLVETGFITNPIEEERLSDPLHQDKIAQALSVAIQSYLKTFGVLRVSDADPVQDLSSRPFPFIVRHDILAAKTNETTNTKTDTAFG